MELIRLNDVSRESRLLHDEIIGAVNQVLGHSLFVFGPEVAEFEKSFASYCGTTYSLGISNGTDALKLALLALGIGPGDEVITSAMSFVATASAIVHAGATPVFVDVVPETLSMDVSKVENVITAKTKAILPVHLYGIPAEMDALKKICLQHKLFLVEDCAESQGALYQGKKTGSLSDVGCFSFFPSKNLGAIGDAGGITTDNQMVYAKIKNLYNHGRDDNGYVHTHIGYTNRLDTLQAAVLNVKLKYLDQRNEKRRQIAAFYDKAFEASPIEFLRPAANVTPCYYVYPIIIENRDEVAKKLREKNVDSGVHFPTPLHLQPALQYLDYKVGDFPIVENYAKKILSIPLNPFLTDDEVDYVSKTVRELTA